MSLFLDPSPSESDKGLVLPRLSQYNPVRRFKTTPAPKVDDRKITKNDQMYLPFLTFVSLFP